MLKTKRITSASNASLVVVSLVEPEFSICGVCLDDGEVSAKEIVFKLSTHAEDCFSEFNQIKKQIKSSAAKDESVNMFEAKQIAFNCNEKALDIAVLRSEVDLYLSFVDGTMLDIRYASPEDAEKDYKKLQNLLVKLENE